MPVSYFVYDECFGFNAASIQKKHIYEISLGK